MFEVTDHALRYLADLLDRRGFPRGAAIRLSHRARRIELHPDGERRGDVGITIDDRTVLVIDPSLADAMSDLRLELRDGGGDDPKLYLTGQ